MQFDFSDFHPLDHHALDLRCARYPGGFRRHVTYWAKYQLDFLAPYHFVRCRLSKHDLTPYWKSQHGFVPEIDKETGEVVTPPDGQVCRWCWAKDV